ncbi:MULTISPECIES: hypothetical protein [unclassified Streptomyces]|uniref:hypothetical protein n=1 Tax=unclassified Streptomyces TaxID=2593676 RepID=UPI00081EC3EE|nr:MULTISPECIES: hypothetical protein [unclassified Streptomyces]MYZ37034.1 hypothetical protein [Streptomyces sp. SID4917]SCF88129.1 hypothetical protein GA0115259_104142 [Streptomyces sp. MnatMP-M17]
MRLFDEVEGVVETTAQPLDEKNQRSCWELGQIGPPCVVKILTRKQHSAGLRLGEGRPGRIVTLLGHGSPWVWADEVGTR